MVPSTARVWGAGTTWVTRWVFEITEVPVGTHTITVWHEVFGELHQSITVEADATTSVSFNFSADAVGAGEGRD